MGGALPGKWGAELERGRQMDSEERDLQGWSRAAKGLWEVLSLCPRKTKEEANEWTWTFVVSPTFFIIVDEGHENRQFITFRGQFLLMSNGRGSNETHLTY